LKKVNIEGMMIAAGQYLKRLIKHRLGGLYSSVFRLLFRPFLRRFYFFNSLVPRRSQFVGRHEQFVNGQLPFEAEW